MLKQRPIIYVGLVAAFGGLLLAGISVDRVLFVGVIAFMLWMHLGGHSHRGQGHGSYQKHDTHGEAVGHGNTASALKVDQVVEK